MGGHGDGRLLLLFLWRRRQSLLLVFFSLFGSGGTIRGAAAPGSSGSRRQEGCIGGVATCIGNHTAADVGTGIGPGTGTGADVDGYGDSRGDGRLAGQGETMMRPKPSSSPGPGLVSRRPFAALVEEGGRQMKMEIPGERAQAVADEEGQNKFEEQQHGRLEALREPVSDVSGLLWHVCDLWGNHLFRRLSAEKCVVVADENWTDLRQPLSNLAAFFCDERKANASPKEALVSDGDAFLGLGWDSAAEALSSLALWSESAELSAASNRPSFEGSFGVASKPFAPLRRQGHQFEPEHRSFQRNVDDQDLRLGELQICRRDNSEQLSRQGLVDLADAARRAAETAARLRTILVEAALPQLRASYEGVAETEKSGKAGAAAPPTFGRQLSGVAGLITAVEDTFGAPGVILGKAEDVSGLLFG